MDQKELRIQIPEGYEIDREKSTFERIVFKRKEDPKTYEEVANLFLRGKRGFYTDHLGHINEVVKVDVTTLRPNAASTKNQLEWLLAVNKLQNVANYLNDGWKPDWNNKNETKWHITYDVENHEFIHGARHFMIRGEVCFKSKKLASKAIDILGEEEVKKALGVYKGC